MLRPFKTTLKMLYRGLGYTVRRCCVEALVVATMLPVSLDVFGSIFWVKTDDGVLMLLYTRRNPSNSFCFDEIKSEARPHVKVLCVLGVGDSY